MTRSLIPRLLFNESVMDRFYQNAVGYDQLFSELTSVADAVSGQTSYPPHNIRQVGETSYVIELAVSGFRPEDLEVTSEKQVLTVRGTRPEASENQQYLHRGLAFRSFEKQIPLAEHVEVRGVSLDYGILSVSVERVLPEKDRKTTFPIRSA